VSNSKLAPKSARAADSGHRTSAKTDPGAAAGSSAKVVPPHVVAGCPYSGPLVEWHEAVLAIRANEIVFSRHEFWAFALPKLPQYGLWSMLHEAQTDFSMFLGLVFLIVVGAGWWSVDAKLSQ
jgi:hypothetical protein